MARTQVLPRARYPSGIHVIGPVAVADDLKDITLEIKRCTSDAPSAWPSDADRLRTKWEFSLDGGRTWQPWQETEDWGGISRDKFGKEIPLLKVAGPLPQGTGRLIRGTLTFDADIRTDCTVDVR